MCGGERRALRWRCVGTAWAVRRHCVGGAWEAAWEAAWETAGGGGGPARTHAPLHDVGREREVPVLDVVRQLDRQLVVRRRLEQPKHLRRGGPDTTQRPCARGRVCVCVCVRVRARVCVCVVGVVVQPKAKAAGGRTRLLAGTGRKGY